MVNNEEEFKYRIGGGEINIGYVRSNPDLLKDFKIGNRVVIWHMDDFRDFVDDLLYQRDIMKAIMTLMVKYDLNKEDVTEFEEFLHYQKGFK